MTTRTEVYAMESLIGYYSEVSTVIDGETHTVLYRSRACYTVADAVQDAADWLKAYEALPAAERAVQSA